MHGDIQLNLKSVLSLLLVEIFLLIVFSVWFMNCTFTILLSWILKYKPKKSVRFTVDHPGNVIFNYLFYFFFIWLNINCLSQKYVNLLNIIKIIDLYHFFLCLGGKENKYGLNRFFSNGYQGKKKKKHTYWANLWLQCVIICNPCLVYVCSSVLSFSHSSQFIFT